MDETVIRGENIAVGVIEYGAAVRSINAFGIELALGFDSLDEYKNDNCCFGAAVGRTANRCAEKNTLDGKVYSLSLNENGVTHLHGGFSGFGRKQWKIERADESSVTLSYFSPAGEEGYPGNVNAEVTYTVENDALLIGYRAFTDSPTWVCLTNHTYFTPDGAGEKSVFGRNVTVCANEISTYDGLMRVTGREKVSGSKDLRGGRRIEEEYDCNYILSGSEKKSFCGRELNFAASVDGSIGIEVWTDMPCMQLYTGNFIPDGTVVSGGKRVGKHSAICFETQFEPGFQSRGTHILFPGATYDRMTAFVFKKTFRETK